MIVELPPQFLQWNYYSRRDSLQSVREGELERDMNLFFLEFTRHNPALSTAYMRPDGKIYVNAKIVGIGYVLKEAFLPEAIKVLEDHISYGDDLFTKASTNKEKGEARNEYQRRGLTPLLKYLYLEPEKAEHRLDFTKMSTIELAVSTPHSSKHTWNIVQKNPTACLLFYRPPSISYELHGWIDIHEEGNYHRFVNAVHDTYHYSPPERRQLYRPVYIFNVEEVYDNSPGPKGFGTKIA